MPYNYYGQTFPLSVQSTSTASYRRPGDWLALPILSPQEERMVGLFPVFDDESNFLAVYFEGGYTVDWGDGNVENFSSGVTAEHTYDFASIEPATLTTRGYRQVTVSVVPQTGSNLEVMDLGVRHSSLNALVGLSCPWLDISVSMPNASSGGSMLFGDYGNDNYLGSLETLSIITTGGATDFSYALAYCYSLRVLTVADMPLVSNAENMCYFCSALQTVNLPDLQGYWYAAFEGCYALESVIMGDVSLVDSGSYLGFYDNYSLRNVEIGKVGYDCYELFYYAGYVQRVTIHDASEIEDASYMFSYCYSLSEVNLGPTPNLEYTDSMFYDCYSLQTIRFPDLSSLSSAYEMFAYCYTLKNMNFPLAPQLGDMDYMFYDCYALESVSFEGLPSLANTYNTFYTCSSLLEVNFGELPSAYTLSYVFPYCRSLVQLTLPSSVGDCYSPFEGSTALTSLVFSDCSMMVGNDGLFDNNPGLASLSVPGIKCYLNLSNCILSQNAIVSVFNDLGVVVVPTVIDVTGNWGAYYLTTQDIEIATDKGWTVLAPPPCTAPPYYCNTNVNTSCLTSLTTLTGALLGSTPFLTYTGGTTIPSEGGNLYSGLVTGGSGSSGGFDLSRYPNGGIMTFTLQYGSGYLEGDNITIPGSLIGGVNGVDSIYITLSVGNGLEYEGAWQGCTSITYFADTGTGSVTNFAGAWQGCTGLTDFPDIDASSGTNFSTSWNYCTGLTSFPTLDTSSGTEFFATWAICYGLTSFPTLDTSSGTDFVATWAYCSNLTSFPPLDFSSGTNFTYTWSYCSSLTTFSPLEFNSGTDFDHTWSYCSSLTSFPNADLPSGENFTFTWYNCSGLTSFPEIDVSAGTNFYGAWANCSGLTSFPGTLNVSSGTNFDSAWAACSGLTSFPLLNLSSGTSFFNTWSGCSGLTSFPGTLDLSSGAEFSQAWSSCASLTSFPGTLSLGLGKGFKGSWEACTGLTSFPGTLDLGAGTDFHSTWRQCTSLTSFPGTLDLSSGTDFSYAWNLCSGLTSFPGTLNLSSGTDFYLTWADCSNLASFPGLDLSSGTDFSGAWIGCTSLATISGTLNLSSGTDFFGAWTNCSSLTSFPGTIDLSSGTTFTNSWYGCTNLVTFPAGMFDTCLATQFNNAWALCPSLSQQSVDNILISINTAGQSNGVLGIGSTVTPSPAGYAAKASLQARGWTVVTT